MKYELDIHLPTVIETFIQCILKGDWETFSKALDLIKNIVDDDNFKTTLDEYNDDLEKKIEALDINVFKSIREGPSVKNMEDVYKILELIQKDSDKIYNEYADVVRDYVLNYFKGYYDPENET